MMTVSIKEIDTAYETKMNDLGYFWSKQMICFWRGLKIVSDSQMDIHLGPHSYCDMKGAIKLAKAVLPSVKKIITFQLDKPDTIYHKSGEKWLAFMPPYLNQIA